MNSEKLKIYENNRKLHEYEMKIIKMSGYLTDYFIDRAIEADDFSQISSFLIDYFAGSAGKPFDVGYLVSLYRDFNLNEKIEDIDFDINEWYKLIHEKNVSLLDNFNKMNDDEYIQYMIDKRKKELDK